MTSATVTDNFEPLVGSAAKAMGHDKARVETDVMVGYAMASQAISLKRIADALDQLAGNNPEKLSLPDAICNAIEQALVNAARR